MEFLRHSLSEPEALRAEQVFRKLFRHDVGKWALTGGFAIELHLSESRDNAQRALNDIDFVAVSFDDIPPSLSNDFLFRHVHPEAKPGKTLLQAIDAENALRIDVFRASPGTMARATSLTGGIRMVALADLIARSARIALGLADGLQVPRKHVRDFMRLQAHANHSNIEAAWRDHRDPRQPTDFAEAAKLLRDLIPARESQLIETQYSTDPTQRCPLCRPADAFPLADPGVVLSILGYC